MATSLHFLRFTIYGVGYIPEKTSEAFYQNLKLWFSAAVILFRNMVEIL